MSGRRYRIERLGRHHARAAFSCGEDSLDIYFRQRARQDDERNVARVFVLQDVQEGHVAGYYTLTASTVQLHDLPLETQRKLPRYPLVPVVLLGRLAVDERYRGQGLGEVLLFDALRRAFDVGTRRIAATAVVVDALHDRASTFYQKYGFLPFPDNPLRLFITMGTIERLLEEGTGKS